MRFFCIARWYPGFCDSRLLLRKPSGRREGHTTTEKIREATCRWLDCHEVYRVAKHVRPVLPAGAAHLCEIEFYSRSERRCCSGHRRVRRGKSFPLQLCAVCGALARSRHPYSRRGDGIPTSPVFL